MPSNDDDDDHDDDDGDLDKDGREEGGRREAETNWEAQDADLIIEPSLSSSSS